MLAQWLERGLGQWLAPDRHYNNDTEDDEPGQEWQWIAPDPHFAASPPSSTGAAAQGRCSSSPNRRRANSREEMTTIFLSPTPVKWNPRRRNTGPQQQDENDNDCSSPLSPTAHTPGPSQHQQPQQEATEATSVDRFQGWRGMDWEVSQHILEASRDTALMPLRNAAVQKDASRLFQYCSSSGAKPFADKWVEKIHSILRINQQRLTATHYSEPNLLVQGRSWNLAALCPDGCTPLQATAVANQVNAAKLVWHYAVEQGVAQDLLVQTNLYGQTALHIAATHGSIAMVEFLQQQEQALLQPDSPQEQHHETDQATPTMEDPNDMPSQKETHDDDDASTTVRSSLRPATHTKPLRHPFGSPVLYDVAGRTAWGAAMTSPNPKARRNRQQLDQLLSSQKQHDTKKPTTATTTTAHPPTTSSPMTHAPPTNSASTARAPALDLWYTTAHLDGQRVHNEDAVLCTPLPFCHGLLFLVCDGHGDTGSVAHLVAQRLPDALTHAATTVVVDPPPPQEEPTTNAKESNETTSPATTSQVYWTKVCQAAATALEKDLEQAHVTGGCTAVWAIVTETLIVTANVGDSRCILVQQESSEIRVKALSEDHKPHVPSEQERIERAGLVVVQHTVPSSNQEDGTTEIISKVQLSADEELGVSRAFGDFEYKQHHPGKQDPNKEEEEDATTMETAVICTPDVTIHRRQPSVDAYLVLACDGIWDVQTNHQVAEFVVTAQQRQLYTLRNNTAWLAQTGHALVEACWHSGDNLSVILVAFPAAMEVPPLSVSSSSSSPPAAPPTLVSKDTEEVDDDEADCLAAKTLVFSPPTKTAEV